MDTCWQTVMATCGHGKQHATLKNSAYISNKQDTVTQGRGSLLPFIVASSLHLSSSRLGSAQLSSAQLSSAQLSSAQLSSASFSTRLSSAQLRKKFFKSPGSSAVVRGFCALALPVTRLASIVSPSAIPMPSMRASGRIAWPSVAVTSLKRLPPDDLSIDPLVDWTIRYGGR